MKKNLWVFNIDNTLANTNEKIQERVEGFGTKLYPFPLPSGFFEDNPDVFLGAAPFIGSAEALRRLEEAGSKVVYVTTRSPWFRNLTEHWLRLNGFPQGQVICTFNKRAIVLKMKPFAFVDDSPHEIDSIKDLVENIYVPAKPYNNGYPNRFETWSMFPLVGAAI